MRERWVIGHQEGNKAYRLSPETIHYLLNTYYRWFPIQNDYSFLLKIIDGCIKIETDFECLLHQTVFKKDEYDFNNEFNFDWIQLPRKFLACLWYTYETWYAQNTTKISLDKHRFYLSIVGNQYSIDCRQHLDDSKGWMAINRLPGVDATLRFTFNPICIVEDVFYIRAD